MAYDPQRKLLFIHIPKNAGKSIEDALGFVPKRYIEQPGSLRRPLNRMLKRLLFRTNHPYPGDRLFGPLDVVLCAQHLGLPEIEALRLLTPAALDETRIFTVVRNPFDRAVSVFHRFSASNNIEDFKLFWRDSESAHRADHHYAAFLRTQLSFLRDLSGGIVVERILRYENLKENFRNLCLEFGLEYKTLEVIGARQHDIPYQEFYDAEAKEMIEHYFQEDITYFDYSFADA